MSLSPSEIKAEYLALLDSWCDVVPEHQHVRVRFPYLDVHRDTIEAFIVPTQQGIAVTDYGMLLGGLETDGVMMQDSSVRHGRVRDFVTRSGFALVDGQLWAESSEDELVMRLHMFSHVALCLQGLVLGSHARPVGLHVERLSERLSAYAIEATINDEIADGNGIRHRFSLSWRRNGHRVVARAVTRFETEQAERFAYALLSLRSAPNRERYKGIAFVPPDHELREHSKAMRIARSVDLHAVPLDRMAMVETI